MEFNWDFVLLSSFATWMRNRTVHRSHISHWSAKGKREKFDVKILCPFRPCRIKSRRQFNWTVFRLSFRFKLPQYKCTYYLQSEMGGDCAIKLLLWKLILPKRRLLTTKIELLLSTKFCWFSPDSKDHKRDKTEVPRVIYDTNYETRRNIFIFLSFFSATECVVDLKTK